MERIKNFKAVLACCLLYLIGTQTCLAQKSPKAQLSTLLVNQDAIQKKIQVSLDPSSEINNLLIVIASSNSKVVFLDNRYHFTGPYQIIINAETFEKGKYSLLVTADDEKEERTLIIK